MGFAQQVVSVAGALDRRARAEELIDLIVQKSF